MNKIQKYKKMIDLKENYFFNLMELQKFHSDPTYSDKEKINKIKECIGPCKGEGCYKYKVYVLNFPNGWFCGLKERFIKKENVK